MTDRPRTTPGGPWPAKIDVHAHHLPPGYREALTANGHEKPDGFPVLPTWSADAHLEMMDRLDIQTAILSVSSPGVNFGEDPLAWARRVNEAGAAIVRQHPGRFGLFASLPLPNVDAALTELHSAFDTLDADGIALETNVDGTYLGNPRFEPLMDELNRRKAAVFIHPTSPACWQCTSLGYPRPILEFLLDTTRAVSDLILNGTLTRYRDIRVIVPHAGAALPIIADRLAGFARRFPLGGQQPGTIDVIAQLQSLHYDLAGFPFPRQLAALLSLVNAKQILYGSDFPFGELLEIEANNEALLDSALCDPQQLRAILRDNALELFPRLGPSAAARTRLETTVNRPPDFRNATRT